VRSLCYENIEIETNYHNKNFALRLALKERLRRTRKSPTNLPVFYRGIPQASHGNRHTMYVCVCHGRTLFRLAFVIHGGPQLSHQNQMLTAIYKSLTANSNRSQQIQIAHSKFKSLTANYKLLTANYKSLTANSNRP